MQEIIIVLKTLILLEIMHVTIIVLKILTVLETALKIQILTQLEIALVSNYQSKEMINIFPSIYDYEDENLHSLFLVFRLLNAHIFV